MANEILKRNPTSTGNRKVFTWSGWVKINRANTAQNCIWFAASSGSSEFSVNFDNAGWFNVYDYSSGAYQYQYVTNRRFRDYANWFHLLISTDTTKSSVDERIKIYINGILYSGTYYSETEIGGINYNTRMNTPGEINYIGQNIYGGANYSAICQLTDLFLVDGQALTPEVFGFYKDGNGYISAGSTQSTDFRNGQWVPRTPREIKNLINDNGGFGVNGFYLPMNDSSNFGADFHTTPNSIITLKGENLPQPRNGAPTTTDAYVSQLRTDPYAANLVLAIPGISGGTSSGFGDYSADIKGSGSNKTPTLQGSISIASIASYYGSAGNFDGSDDRLDFSSSADFALPGDFTMEMWVNWKSVGNGQLLSAGPGNNTNAFYWQYYSGQFQFGTQGVATDNVVTFTPVANQWYHVAAERKGTVLTQYVNGVAVGVSTNVTRSYVQGPLYVGWAGAGYINAYIQDVRIYKGAAKYTGGFDVPKPYTPVGISTWRAVSDTCQNNFATLNPLNKDSSNSLSNGNLTVLTSSSGQGFQGSTIGISTGKWYWEIRVDDNSGNTSIGIAAPEFPTTSFVGSGSTSYGYFASNGNKVNNGSSEAYGSTYTTGDIMGVSLDSSNGTLTYYKNGTSQGTAFSSLSGTFLPAISDISSGSSSTLTANFGQNPTFSGNTTAGTFTDSNGKGLFKYQPPSGFLALCEDNLPTPTIKDPGEYFKTVLWTGDGSLGRSIVGVGFTPDLVWIKTRTDTYWHEWYDSVRMSPVLFSNVTNAETTIKTLNSFDNDGFTVSRQSGYEGTNQSGKTYVAWCWKAGGPAVTNTDGSITSRVSANQTAGFSIVSYTGTGSAGTVGHGLGKNPGMIIIKSRDSADTWPVWHQSLASPTNNYLRLESTAGVGTLSNYWNSSAPNTTTFGLAGGSYAHNLSGDRHIAYCWAEIEGFSKFGSWNGNASADGPFVYCGFKPAFILTKRTDSSTNGNWTLFDSSRSSTNPVGTHLRADTSEVELNFGTGIDIVSNGFKIREAASALNNGSGTYIFAAFAESPFTTANAK